MLDQSVVNFYLRCPECHAEESLRCNQDKIICNSCSFESSMRFGIPALINKEAAGTHSYKFLNLPINERNKQRQCKSWNLVFFQRIIVREVIHFFNVIIFSCKFGLRKILQQRFCREIEKALYYGWTNYFNLLLKANEAFQFNKMKKYIAAPSLEIGCGDSRTTNMIFRDNLQSITFGCEYFMDTFLNPSGMLSDEMYKVIEHYVGGGVNSLPFRSNIFTSIIMVHVVDHIVHIDQCFKELNRILKPGGYLIMSAYSKNVFEQLPGVKLRKMFSAKWARHYKERRIKKDNPRGWRFRSDFEYDATGQNIFSIEEWKNIAKNYGFDVIEHTFFGKYFSYFMNIEYKGYYRSILFNQFLYAAISEIIEREKINPLSEEESTNIILVMKKEMQKETMGNYLSEKK